MTKLLVFRRTKYGKVYSWVTGNFIIISRRDDEVLLYEENTQRMFWREV